MKPLASHNYNYIFYIKFREMLPTIRYFLYTRVYYRRRGIDDTLILCKLGSLNVCSLYKPSVCYYV